MIQQNVACAHAVHDLCIRIARNCTGIIKPLCGRMRSANGRWNSNWRRGK